MSPHTRSGAAPVRATRNVVRAQERGDRTRDAIIDETIRCINEEGFAAASARHIAERAGVTWGVIQYHFGDRQALLSAVIAHGYDRFRQSVRAVSVPASAPGGTARPRVEAVVEAAWAAFSSPESRASLEILLAARTGPDQDHFVELGDMAKDMRALSSVLVDDGAAAGRAGRVLGELLWATLRGLVMAQMLSPQPIDSTRERALLVDLLTGLLDGTSAEDARS